MKLELVDDFKDCWKWLSTQCMTLAAAIQGAWLYIPDDMKQDLPHNILTGATIFLLALGVIGRLVKQGKTDAPTS